MKKPELMICPKATRCAESYHCAKAEPHEIGSLCPLRGNHCPACVQVKGKAKKGKRK
jgi:hypothetical protein